MENLNLTVSLLMKETIFTLISASRRVFKPFLFHQKVKEVQILLVTCGVWSPADSWDPVQSFVHSPPEKWGRESEAEKWDEVKIV